jgi:2-polyprenyl-3-methyl-5-hydroxy-6-metoxy-1,4-benzoquinol methylase
MTNLKQLYQEYGNYNILYNQLNLPSPSMEYAWRKTKKIIQDEAQRIAYQSNKNLTIGDVGCGNGALIIRLAELTRKLHQQINYQGFDISKPFVNYGRQATKFKKLSNISFNYLDIEKDKLPNKFDLIICSEVLEHLHNPENILNKLYQGLNNNGCLLLSTPNSKNLIKYPFFFLKKIVGRKDSQEISKVLTQKEQRHKLAELEQHLYVFSHSELRKLLFKIGFAVVKTPRSTTLFGGPFLDNHPLLFALTIIGDGFFDLISLPQLGWDSIFICRKGQ